MRLPGRRRPLEERQRLRRVSRAGLGLLGRQMPPPPVHEPSDPRSGGKGRVVSGFRCRNRVLEEAVPLVDRAALERAFPRSIDVVTWSDPPRDIMDDARASRFTVAGISPRSNARVPAAADEPRRAPPAIRSGQGRAELAEEPVCSLQVEPDHLVLLRSSPFQPIGEPLVEPRALILRHALVRRIPDQEMAERERLDVVQVRAFRTDELLAHERREIGLAVREIVQRLGIEHLTDDRRALERDTLPHTESVDPGSEERRDRRGHGELVEIAGRDPPTAPRTRSPSSTRVASISSANSGCPSARPRPARARPDPRRRPRGGSRRAHRTPRSRAAPGDRRGVELAASPAGRTSRSSGRASRRGGSERRATSPRCTRSGRGASARPTGCRRSRGRRAVTTPSILEQPPHRPERLFRDALAPAPRSPARPDP